MHNSCCKNDQKMWSNLMSNKKKILTITVCISIFTIAIILIIAKMIKLEKQGKEIAYKTLGIDKLYEKEKIFKENPNFNDCFYVFEKYRFFKKYEKASYYGERCLDLITDKESDKLFLIHLWLADVYNDLDNKNNALKNLRLAYRFDVDQHIDKNNWIEKLGLKPLAKKLQTSPNE